MRPGKFVGDAKSHSFGRTIVLGMVLLFGLAVMWSSPVAAHGKNNLNLKKYCAHVFKTHKNKLSRKLNQINYYYDRKKRSWMCRLTFPHFQKGHDSRVRAFNVEDACRWQYKTRIAHYHDGDDLKNRRTIHCGIRTGTVLKDTKLSLCNKSHVREIYAAYAYWVPKQRRGRGGGWSATGWYKIQSQRCRTVTVGHNGYKGSVYVFAEGGGTKWTGRDARFCVHDSKGFTLRRADESPCNGQNYKRVRMTKYKVRPGGNRYNFRP